MPHSARHMPHAAAAHHPPESQRSRFCRLRRRAIVLVLDCFGNIAAVAEIATLSGSKQLYNPQNMLNIKHQWLHQAFEAVIERPLGALYFVKRKILLKIKRKKSRKEERYKRQRQKKNMKKRKVKRKVIKIMKCNKMAENGGKAQSSGSFY